MATILTMWCFHLKRRELIPFAQALGFTMDFWLLYTFLS
jgi:hypothetical protein